MSFNKLRTIHGIDYLPLIELNLAGNELESLDGMTNLPYLTSLNVSHNKIRSLGPVEGSVQLHFIDASDNDIREIRQVEFLRNLQWLQILRLLGNGCCSKIFYRYTNTYFLPSCISFDRLCRCHVRQRVLIVLQTLMLLDNIEVSAEEKVGESWKRNFIMRAICTKLCYKRMSDVPLVSPRFNSGYTDISSEFVRR